MAKMGRPPKEIDWKIFDELCEIHCTREEISNIFDISPDTIENKIRDEFGETFSAYYKKKSANGKKSLRRRLYDIAHSNHPGAITAAIWLSKNYLGMRDKFEDDKSEMEPFIISTTNGVITLGAKKKEVKSD